MNAIALSGVFLDLVAQEGPNVDVGIDPAAGVVRGAVGAFLTTLAVGGIMLAVAPEYTERMRTIVLGEPVDAFVYGIVALLVVVIVTVVLAITIIGILLALVAYVVWAVGSAIAYLAIGDRLVGHEDGWLKPLLVGAEINGALSSFAPRGS